jgi:hypothetical protein
MRAVEKLMKARAFLDRSAPYDATHLRGAQRSAASFTDFGGSEPSEHSHSPEPRRGSLDRRAPSGARFAEVDAGGVGGAQRAAASFTGGSFSGSVQRSARSLTGFGGGSGGGGRAMPPASGLSAASSAAGSLPGSRRASPSAAPNRRASGDNACFGRRPSGGSLLGDAAVAASIRTEDPRVKALPKLDKAEPVCPTGSGSSGLLAKIRLSMMG